MKRAIITALCVAVFAIPIASGSSGGGMSSAPSPSMERRSPPDIALDYYSAAEHRLDGLAKTHDEMKASTDAQKVAKLQAKIAKGLENAAADFERAVKNDATLYQAYSELGFTLRKMGKFDESLAAYDKSLSIQPDYTPALEYRADALLIAMKGFVASRRAAAAGLDAAQLEAFAKWVDEREVIHTQTAALTSQTSSFRS